MSVAAHRFDNGLRYGGADHARNTQFTPAYVLDLVRLDLGGIDLDPCTTAAADGVDVVGPENDEWIRREAFKAAVVVAAWGANAEPGRADDVLGLLRRHGQFPRKVHALGVAGFETVWACEADTACRNILAARLPGLPVYPDVHDIDGTEPPVDVIAGGFPCQDLSYAGAGKGIDGGDRSILWYEMARAVRLHRPRHVIVENVPGLLTRGLGRVLYDLAEAGYVGSWCSLRAADVGAPHRRERVFVLATLAPDAERERRDGRGGRDQGGTTGAGDDGRPVAQGPAEASTDADDVGREGQLQRQRQGRATGEPQGHRQALADAGREPGDGHRHAGQAEPRQAEQAPAAVDWGAYEPAIRRWERTLGRPAPAPVDDRGRLNPSFVEWMLGFPDSWTDGESRTQRLKMLGNSVQVQVGTQAGLVLRQLALT